MMKSYLLLFALLCSGLALAHHSVANFDMDRYVTISGTVNKLEWTNPHMWLWVDVTAEDGTVEHWGMEGASPANMKRRLGWSKNTVSTGDKVTVKLHPFRDDHPGGSLYQITLPDGSVIGGSGR